MEVIQVIFNMPTHCEFLRAEVFAILIQAPNPPFLTKHLEELDSKIHLLENPFCLAGLDTKA